LNSRDGRIRLIFPSEFNFSTAERVGERGKRKRGMGREGWEGREKRGERKREICS